MANPTIRDIRVILTEPDNIRLVIVKVETSEPGLYGLGCATFTQRPSTVVAAVEDYLRPFLIGRDVADIEDIWQSSYVSSYWRNGPVLNNALSGVDQALWDIKGKMANMPVYDLLGGKAREAAAVYVHCSGDSHEEVGDKMQAFMEKGHHHIRVQMATPGYATYGNRGAAAGAATASNRDVSQGPIPVTTWLRDYDRRQVLRPSRRHLRAQALHALRHRPVRIHPRPLRLRRRDPPRRARAHPADPRRLVRQGGGEVPALLPRGPLLAGGQRVFPHGAPAMRHADRHGRALQFAPRDRADDQGPADRLPAHAHVADRRHHAGQEVRRHGRAVQRSHRLARARATPRRSGMRRTSPSTSTTPISASRKPPCSASAPRRCFRAARNCATA